MESSTVKRKKVLIIEFKSEAIRDRYSGLQQSNELLEVIHVIRPENEASETLCPIKGMWDAEGIEALKKQLNQ